MNAKYLTFVFLFKNKILKKVKSRESSSRTEIVYKNLARQFFLYFGPLYSLRDVILLHLIRLIIDHKQNFYVHYFWEEGLTQKNQVFVRYFSATTGLT